MHFGMQAKTEATRDAQDQELKGKLDNYYQQLRSEGLKIDAKDVEELFQRISVGSGALPNGPAIENELRRIAKKPPTGVQAFEAQQMTEITGQNYSAEDFSIGKIFGDAALREFNAAREHAMGVATAAMKQGPPPQSGRSALVNFDQCDKRFAALAS